MNEQPCLLEIKSLSAGYQKTQILQGVDFRAARGEISCILGRNGAGKTTLLKAIMGLVPASAGQIRFAGQDITNRDAHRRPALGIGYVPQGRRLFSELSVHENLLIGERVRPDTSWSREELFSLFPILKSRLDQKAGTLSGGEQQMLAISRALCLQPTLLLLDEPAEGLQPSMVALIFDVIAHLREKEVGIVLVEQRTEPVLSIANQITFIENGYSRATMQARKLQSQPHFLQQYVGL